ncbi:hypothetical protein [Fusibacter bizertensis]
MKTGYNEYDSLNLKNPFILPKYSLSHKLSTSLFTKYYKFRLIVNKIWPVKDYQLHLLDGCQYSECTDNITDEQIKIDGKIDLESIHFLDLLPKENIIDFKKSLRRFVDKNKIDFSGPYFDEDQADKIDKFSNIYDYKSFLRLPIVAINDSSDCYKYVKKVSLSLYNLSNTLCIVDYELVLTDEAKKNYNDLIKMNVKGEDRLSKNFNTKWFEVNKMGMGVRSEVLYKADLVNNFISEIKWLSACELAKYFNLFFHNHNMLQPSINCFRTNIKANKEHLKFWRSLGMSQYADYSTNYDTCICWTSLQNTQLSDRLNLISSFEQSNDFNFSSYSLPKYFMAFMVGNSTNVLTKMKLKKINNTVGNMYNHRFNNLSWLLKEKASIEVELLVPMRLLNEITTFEYFQCFDEFQSNYISDKNYITRHLNYLNDDIKISIQKYQSIVQIINSHIDIRNHQENFKLQWWIFLITFTSLISSIITLYITINATR